MPTAPPSHSKGFSASLKLPNAIGKWYPDAPCRDFWPTFLLECGQFSPFSCIKTPYMEHLGYVKTAGFWKELPCSPPCQIIVNFTRVVSGHTISHHWVHPPPRILVTTRMITLLVGIPYKTLQYLPLLPHGGKSKVEHNILSGWCSTPTFVAHLLIIYCENAYPLRICSSLSTTQLCFSSSFCFLA